VESRHSRRKVSRINGYQANEEKFLLKSRLGRLALALLCIAAFVTIGVVLKDKVGTSFDTTYRVACAGACLLFINRLRLDYPKEIWPRNSLAAALLINTGIFFTPLVDRPSSRGEVMRFALPDTVVALVVLIASYRVTNVRQRAARQTLILGLVVTVVFCGGLFALMLAELPAAHTSNGRR
jgi:ABC-type Fe3+-siderophore transport system permease subunit